jgi:hypothetical protein
MNKFIYAMLLLISSLVLPACGGGGGEDGGFDYYTPPSYGSIAINQNTGAGGIATSYSGQSIANSNALKQCGSSCITILEFGSYMCGALARSDNLVFGWASDSKKSSAESNAMNSCISRSGVRCQIVLSNCNDS